MTKIAYKDEPISERRLNWTVHEFNSYDVIEMANKILDDYQRRGYILTLRQLYYQFVARALILNQERSYKNLGSLMNRARVAGLVSWTAIEDRNRGRTAWSFEENELEVLNGIEYGIAFDQWARQDCYVEVWVEKDALSNVIARPCRDLLVPYMATKGYLSASEAWRAGQRFARASQQGKKCILIHLGDHDPEGIDMTRDNRDRVDLFSNYRGVEVRRIALNMDQVEQYGPPPNYAKASSSRFEGYVSEYGETCWELDALDPEVIDRLIRDEIEPLIDRDLWAEVQTQEDEQRERLAKLHDNWDEVSAILDERF